jgi:hypothetical protein
VERLICSSCEHRVSRHDVVCRHCGVSLLEEGAVVVEPVPVAAPPAEGGASPLETTADPTAPLSQQRCPECKAPVPDPHNLVCLVCMAELPGSDARPDGATVPSRVTPSSPWELHFDFGVVRLRKGDEMVLGRAADQPVVRELSKYDNVSRLHATVGVDDDGVAWIRDERSTNHTFVDDRQLAPGVVTPLGDGARVRLASNVRAVVRRADASHE